MDEHRYVECHGGLPQRVERRVVERAAEVGADVGTHQAEVGDGPPELDHGGIDVLHRQLGEPTEPVGMGGDDGRHLVVVPAAETGGDVGLDVVEVGDRVGRQHLQVDAESVVHRQAQAHVHERAVAVVHPVEHIVAHPEPWPTFGTDTEFGSVVAGAAEHAFQHHVRMHVDHRNLLRRADRTLGWAA